jgi:hypothetical protein
MGPTFRNFAPPLVILVGVPTLVLLIWRIRRRHARLVWTFRLSAMMCCIVLAAIVMAHWTLTGRTVRLVGKYTLEAGTHEVKARRSRHLAEWIRSEADGLWVRAPERGKQVVDYWRALAAAHAARARYHERLADLYRAAADSPHAAFQLDPDEPELPKKPPAIEELERTGGIPSY